VEHVHAGVPEDIRRNLDYGRVPNIMPYPLQDGFARELKPRSFRVAVLENDMLRASFLLEMGGRLWSLVHKPSGRELLTVNPALQIANLALRNAWFSGGVEWNVGTIGHSPFTCSPLFAARVTGRDGMPILRLYEWERLRGTPFQIDAYLPDGSSVLFVQVRIMNPHERVTPVYWWSNIAVPETAATRVLVPADSAYHFNYRRLQVIPVPQAEGLDASYATNIPQSSDYFYHIPHGRRPWIAALDGAGEGLVQVSTEQLGGRKLFVWGMGRGGRQWQKFLSPTGQPYIEIQAGLARTQLEHLRMPPGEWSWLEAYGLLQADPTAVHSANWSEAQQAVEHSLERLISRAALQAEYGRASRRVDLPPDELLQRGSGWGNLERQRRARAGERDFAPVGLLFDEASLGPKQEPWLHLLRDGSFPQAAADEPPRNFMAQDEWRPLLETAVQQPAEDPAAAPANWSAWYHLGILRYCAGEKVPAVKAWETSLAHARTPWALRNLALAASAEGNLERAAELYGEAVRLVPHIRPLVTEAGRFLIDAQKAQQWLDLLGELSPEIRTDGRVRLLEAQAALELGHWPLLEDFFARAPVLPDLREGEQSLAELWHAWHVRRLSNLESIPVNEALHARVRRDFPLPAGFDFNMVVD
jgi:tetratricopeptide (TPR) repeat protein